MIGHLVISQISLATHCGINETATNSPVTEYYYHLLITFINQIATLFFLVLHKNKAQSINKFLEVTNRTTSPIWMTQLIHMQTNGKSQQSHKFL